MSSKKLTKPQLWVLERMAEGEKLASVKVEVSRTFTGSKTVIRHLFVGDSEYLPASTVPTLRKAGMIRAKVEFIGLKYELTPAGKDALQSQEKK